MKPTLRLELQQVPPDEPQEDWLGPMTESVQAVEYRCSQCGDLLQIGPKDKTVVHLSPHRYKKGRP